MGSVFSLFAWRSAAQQQRRRAKLIKQLLADDNGGARADDNKGGARYEWFRLTRNFLTEEGFMLTEGETGMLDRSRTRRHLRNHALIESVFIDETAALRALSAPAGNSKEMVCHWKLIASPGSKVDVLPLRVTARLGATTTTAAAAKKKQAYASVYVPQDVVAPHVL